MQNKHESLSIWNASLIHWKENKQTNKKQNKTKQKTKQNKKYFAWASKYNYSNCSQIDWEGFCLIERLKIEIDKARLLLS